MIHRKTIYVSIRVDLAAEHEISGDDIQNFLAETEYSIPSAAGLEVEDTWLNGTLD